MHRSRNWITVDPRIYFILPATMLIVPIPWIFAWIFAVVVHEAGHYLAIVLSGSKVTQVQVGMHGVVMHAHFLNRWHETIGALMGPIASFVLVCLAKWLPRVAIIGCVQGIYNMLPIHPFDGGRIARTLIETIFPIQWHNKVEWIWGNICFTVLGIVVLRISLKYTLGWIPVALYLMVLVRSGQIKFPCKREREGVQ